jgi:hypothetical protein
VRGYVDMRQYFNGGDVVALEGESWELKMVNMFKQVRAMIIAYMGDTLPR